MACMSFIMLLQANITRIFDSLFKKATFLNDIVALNVNSNKANYNYIYPTHNMINILNDKYFALQFNSFNFNKKGVKILFT